MALPLAPLAPIVLRYGAVALAAYAVSRSVHRGRTDQRSEDALDALDEGLTAHRPRDGEREQINATARFRRIIRFGNTAVEIDASALGRIRLRKV